MEPPADSDPAAIRQKIRDGAMTVDQFLVLPAALALVQRNDRVVIDLYVSILIPASAETSRQ